MRLPTLFVLASVLANTACGGGGDPVQATVSIATSTTTSSATTTVAPATITTVAPATITTTMTTKVTSTATTTATTTTATTTNATPTTVTPPPTTARSPRFYDFSAVGPIIQDYVDDQGLNGAGLIVVERDDGVVHHQHWGEFGPDRISLIASSSKMLVAGILMHLHDRGLLDVDAPVADVVPWDVDPAITPVQLVSNTSGLVGLLPNVAYGPYICQFLPVGTLQDCARQILTTPDDDADVIPPDTNFRYGGGQWQVAGAVAELASGRSWAELVDEVYVKPCGLDGLAFNNPFTQFDTPPFTHPPAFAGNPETLVATDNPNLEGGAYSTTGSYGALLLMYLRGGVCAGGRVLSVAAVDRLVADRTLAVLDGDDADGVLAYGVGTGYGMGWWIDRATGRRSDGGAYGSMPWLNLSDGYGAYLVLEATSAHGSALAEKLYGPVAEAVRATRD